MKIAWLWLESERRFVRLEELTPEVILLTSLFAPGYGADIDRTWEECTRRVTEEEMEKRVHTFYGVPTARSLNWTPSWWSRYETISKRFWA